MITSQTQDVPNSDSGVSCGSNGPQEGYPFQFNQDFSFDICGLAVGSYRVVTIESHTEDSDGVGPCNQVWREDTSEPESTSISIHLDGTLTYEQLNCLSKTPAETFRDRAVLYKNDSTHLYSLRADDAQNVSTWGEVVNGEFRIPGPNQEGELIIEPRLGDGAAELFQLIGATSLNLPGWMSAAGSAGTLIAGSKTIACTTPCSVDYKFHIQTARGSADDVGVDFHWYRRDPLNTCQIIHQITKLQFSVRPLPCTTMDADPVRPQLWPPSSLDQHYELTIPCCPSCETQTEACAPGNLTNAFVAWPNASGLIGDGHARGWSILPGAGPVYTLRAGGSDGLENVFEP